MTDLLAPMLSSPIPDNIREGQLDRFDTDDSIRYEQKCDGHRRLVYVVDGEVIPLNRSGEPTTLPMLMIKILSVQRLNFAVDGELMGTGADRRLYLFDLPWAQGMIGPTTPFFQRRAALETLYHNLLLVGGGIELLPSMDTTASKRWLRNTLHAGGGEGLVIKPEGHRYVSGRGPSGRERRSREVWKAKWTKQADCVVTGLRIDGHDNIGLGMFDAGGDVHDVGEVTAQAGDGPQIKRRFERPNELVVEVTLLNVSAGGQLVQPTLPRLRDDKPPEACSVSQLAMLRDDKTILVPTLQGGLRAAN